MSSNHSYTEERKNDSYQVNNLKDQQRTDKRKDKNLGDNRSTGDRHIFKVVAVPQEGDTFFFIIILYLCINFFTSSCWDITTWTRSTARATRRTSAKQDIRYRMLPESSHMKYIISRNRKHRKRSSSSKSPIFVVCTLWPVSC